MSPAHAGVIADFVVLVASVALGMWLCRDDERWERVVRRGSIALRAKWLATPWALVVAFLVGTALAAIVGGFSWMLPREHAEFAHLLVSDTLAHGRVVNPTPAYWEFFETFQVVLQPFYAGAVAPGQGAMLAVGQLVAHPAVGVWVAHGLAAAACAWALRGVLRPGVALVAALALVATARALHTWGIGYMPGGLVVAAGALVFGAAQRAAKDPSVLHGVVAGLGGAVLVLTLPWQGAAMLIALVALSPWSKRWVGRFFGPFVVLVVAGVVVLGAYNRAVTGRSLQSPADVHAEQYGSVSPIAFVEPELPPLYLHRELRKNNNRETQTALARRDAPAMALVAELWGYGRFLIGMTLIAPLASCWRRRREQAVRMAAGLVGIGVLVQLVLASDAPRELAPVAAAFLGLVALGTIDLLTGPRPLQRALGLAALAAAIAGPMQVFLWMHAAAPDRFEARRRGVIAELLAEPGKHLVFVRYAAEHDPREEWVFNRASLDEANILWARDMGDARNAALAERLRDRAAWVVEPDRPEADAGLTRLKTTL